MTTLQILQRAREIIAAPENWTKGYFARDEHNLMIDFGHKKAVCFCAWGAVNRAHLELTHVPSIMPQAYGFLQAVVGRSHGSVQEFNDDRSTTHTQVLAMFDRAIERAR